MNPTANGPHYRIASTQITADGHEEETVDFTGQAYIVAGANLTAARTTADLDRGISMVLVCRER